jgi:K+-sensing histidine kinase KdpD
MTVIATYHTNQEYVYSEDDLEILQAMADQAAIAINNIQEMQLRIEAERRAYLADLAQTTAHHLKNELGSIRPMVEIMLEDEVLHLSSDHHKSLEMICKNASNSERLVARLFAPFRDLKCDRMGVKMLITEAKNSVSQLLSGIEVLTCCPETLPDVYVDRLGTVGVLSELFTNAQEVIKKKSKTGRIEINAKLAKKQQFIEIEFTNDGPPISPKLQEEIFQPHKEEVIESSGFGLGLWSARVLLERENGSIALLKSDEENTTFLIRLPTFQEEV